MDLDKSLLDDQTSSDTFAVGIYFVRPLKFECIVTNENPKLCMQATREPLTAVFTLVRECSVKTGIPCPRQNPNHQQSSFLGKEQDLHRNALVTSL